MKRKTILINGSKCWPSMNRLLSHQEFNPGAYMLLGEEEDTPRQQQVTP